MTTEKAILIESFKTKRLDGHSIRTIYALTEKGIVQIERRMISNELNEGFIPLRTFGKWIYQYEIMVFKLASFGKIATDIGKSIDKLNMDNVYSSEDITVSPNEKQFIKIIK